MSERERERWTGGGITFVFSRFFSVSHGHAAPNLITSRATPLYYHLISDL